MTERLRGNPAWRRIGPLACALAAAVCCPTVQAAQLPWLHDIFATMQTTSDTMAASVLRALATHEVNLVVNVLFSALALFLFVWKFSGFAMRGFDMLDVLELMFTIAFVYVLLTAYRTLIPVVVEGSRFVGDALGMGISHADGSATLAESIFGTLLGLSLHPVCDGGFFHCLGPNLLAIVTVGLGDIAILAIGAVATVAEVWMSWCFQIAFAFGWMTIPFLLYRRLSFLFDGWLRFFCSVLMYDIIAKVALAIVLLSIKVMQDDAPGSTGATIDVHTPYDLMALMLFIIVGCFVIGCVGRFATVVVNGVPGVSGVLQDMARGAARSFGGR